MKETSFNSVNLLSNDTCQAIDHWISKYPPEQKQSALLPALLLVQDEQGGWLAQAALDAVANYLEIPKIAVYEVATFYSMYELQPVGRHKIAICTNISCMLSGSDQIVQHLKKSLKIGFSETTSDGKFTLKEVECLGACTNAPVFYLNKRYYENLTLEKVDEILTKLD